MKRVAIITSTYTASIWSGLGRHSFYLAYALERCGWDVTVYSYTPGTRHIIAEDRQILVHRFCVRHPSEEEHHGNALPLESTEEWNNLIARELQRHHFDLILLPTCHGWEAAKTVNCPIIGFVPFAYNLTGWINNGKLSDRVSALQAQTKASEKEFFAKCSMLVCHNQRFAHMVATEADRDVYVLPNCWLPIMEEDTEKRPTRQMSSLVYVGKINKENSIETVLRAMPGVRNAALSLCYPEVTKRYIPKIEAVAEQLGIEGAIDYIGWLPGERVRDLYRKSTISVTASHLEPYGFSVLDAMAYGAIPLVSAWSGLDMYVEPEHVFTSISSLHSMLEEIFGMSASERTELQNRNYERLRTQFMESPVTATLEDIIRQCK